MRRLRYVGLAVVILTAVGIGLYYWMEYDPQRAPALTGLSPGGRASGRLDTRPNRPEHPRKAPCLEKFRYLECVIAADLKEPSRLFAAVMRRRGATTDVVGFYSHDGSATWQLGCERPALLGESLDDPAVAYGAKGAVYLVHTRYKSDADQPFGTAGAGGCWSPLHLSTVARPGRRRRQYQSAIDRPWIAVDSTTGPGRGRHLLIGNVDISRSFFSLPTKQIHSLRRLRPSPVASWWVVVRANPVVLADGTLLLLYDAFRSGARARHRPQTQILRSTDRGNAHHKCSGQHEVVA